MLQELLTENRIRCAASVSDWRSAIRLAAGPLVDEGCVTPGYVDAMIVSVETHGPYIVIDEGLALPHARPEDGALRPALAMLLLREPVDLLGNAVRVFVVLSAVDNHAHIEAMRSLAELVWAGCDARTLAAAPTPAAAMACIGHYNKEEKR